MKIKYHLVAAIWVAKLISLDCFAGSLVIINDYPELFIVHGGLSFIGSLNMSAEGYSNGTSTFLTYSPKNDPKAPYSIVRIEDFLGKKAGIYRVSKTIKKKLLEIYFVVYYTDCAGKNECLFKEDNIQDFNCTVVDVLYGGVALQKSSKTEL